MSGVEHHACSRCTTLKRDIGAKLSDLTDIKKKLVRFAGMGRTDELVDRAAAAKQGLNETRTELEAHQADCDVAIAAPKSPAKSGPGAKIVLPLDEVPLDLSFAGLPDVSWMDAGLCAQTDPEAFFPEKGGSTRDAKSVCAKCPVSAECLDWALETQQRFGIWGGKSERERRRIAAVMAGENPTAGRVCALSECSVEIHVDERPNKKFCTPEHAHRATYLTRTAS